MITPGTDTINVNGTVTLAAKDGAGVDGSGVARGGSLFSVGDGDDLTVTGGTYRNIASSGNGGVAHMDGGTLVLSGGEFTGNSARNGGVVFQEKGELSVTGGLFANNRSTLDADGDKGGGVIYSKTKVSITGGEFTGNSAVSRAGVIYSKNSLSIINGTFSNNKAVAGGVVYNENLLEVSGGTFSENEAGDGGVVYSSADKKPNTVTISGGSFDRNSSTAATFDVTNNIYSPYNGGGVIHGVYTTLTITGGSFAGNQALNGGSGGVIYQYGKATTLIKGTADSRIKFESNVQNPGECTRDQHAKCTDKKLGGERSGGGVLYMNEDERANQGVLTVQGNVLFEGNGEKSSGAYSGGGALWVRGTLNVKNGIDGSRPVFTNNWATMVRPYDDAGNPVGELERGGAGGAIFLMMVSTATITGGTYTGNTSGYLGGAIYTEEDSTTYVGKAVAFDNTAGHFGGGLWFCPSGNSTASKGGNIALFDNKVDPSIDANPDNGPKKDPESTGTQTTSAGADLAIMNPWFKFHNPDDVRDNQFQLLNTWFTNRSEDAVQWHWDNTPLMQSSGFADSWFNNAQGKKALLASTDLHSTDDVQDPGVITLSAAGTPGAIPTGVAFKATVLNEQSKDEAKKTAQITINGNRSRLSGGGFGSNGVVVFDTPYSMSWEKVDADTKAHVGTSSAWTLETVKLDNGVSSPYMDEDMRPTDCQTVVAGRSNCWSKGEDGVWTVTILDNGPRDNDPEIGAISIDNLAPGTYRLSEAGAPTGYRPTGNEYTFTIVAVKSDDKTIPKEPNLEYAPGSPKKDDPGLLYGDKSENGQRLIGNAKIVGVLAWTKTDDAHEPLAGSAWTLSQTKDSAGATVAGRSWTVEDCVVSGADADSDTACGDLMDRDPGEGGFRIDIAVLDTQGKPVYPDGTYTLMETKIPDGYWASTDTTHTVVIGTGANGNRTVKWDNGSDAGIQIVNHPTRVSWSKADAADTDVLLGGSEWTVAMTKDADGKELATSRSWRVVDCRPGSCATPEGGLADADDAAGKFTVQGLLPGTYKLTESKAPDGYVKFDKPYTFTIGADQPEGNIVLKDADGKDVAGNVIVNAKSVSVLPFTGGRSARDWLLAGGGLLAGAAAWLAVLDARRRRAAMAV